MALNRISTNVPIILGAIKRKLIADGVYNDNTVFLSDNPDGVKLPPNTSYCIITPGVQETQDQETDLVSGTINVMLKNYLSLDQATRSDIQLSESPGIMVQRLAVHTALHQVDLVVGANWILAEPMRLKSFGEVTEDRKWASLNLAFNVRYGLDSFAVYLPPSDTCGQGEFSCEYSFEYF